MPPKDAFVSLRAGKWHSCGLKEDGAVACWGLNTNAPVYLVGQSTPSKDTFASVSGGA